jgi:hypothetical protein
MADSEITWLITILAILSIFAAVCTAYSQSYVDFPLGNYYGPHNYTVTQNFLNISTGDIHKTDVWGSWSHDNTSGLYPTGFIDRSWLPGEDYWSRVQFGNVRLVNNTWTEKYYLNNIARASNDKTKILIASQGTTITTGSTELYLVIDYNRVYLEMDTLEFGYTIPLTGTQIYDKGYHIPGGAIKGNISYTAEFANGGITDPMTGKLSSNVNGLINVYVYWDGALTFYYTYEELPQAAAANLQRQADVQPNIGADDAYSLQILSHYEDVRVVQISTDSGTNITGYDDVLDWTTTLIGVLTWGIPFDVGIPQWILFLCIGLPEFALGYIIVRLLRGGG